MGRTSGVVRTVVLGGAVVLAALPAGAQDDTSTSSSVPESSTTTAPDASTTSTAPPVTQPPVGELGDDIAAAEGDAAFQELEAGIQSRGPYAGQPPFDAAAANAVFAADLSRAQSRLAAARAAITAAERELAAAHTRLAELDASLAPLRAQEQDAVTAAVAAHDDFTEAAVDAYIRGNDEDATLLVSSEGATDYAVGKVFLEAALSKDRDVIDAYLVMRAALSTELDRVAADLIVARDQISRQEHALEWGRAAEVAATYEVDMWSAGSHAFIAGYTFPVDGPVKFGDSFGAPRMLGTPYEHWHEGTDVFAATGTPLVAAEDGVLDRVKSGGVLGGNSLRIIGASGYTHYYAHLSAFADGMVDGRPVKAGELVGFVGDTGNARGTSPHLHYEIQLSDGTSLNPYPVLSVAHRWREQLRALQPEAAAGD